jgi:hypothetical protein
MKFTLTDAGIPAGVGQPDLTSDNPQDQRKTTSV